MKLYLRGKRWWIRYTLNGRQEREPLRTTSAHQARTLAKRREAEICLGQAASPRRRAEKLATVVERFLTARRVDGLDPKTLRAYRHELEQFAAYAATRGATRLNQLTPGLLQEYKERLATEGFTGVPGSVRSTRRRKSGPPAATSLNRKVMLPKMLAAWAVEMELLAKDPFTAVKLPPKGKGTRRAFTPQQNAEIVDALPEPYRDVFQFLAMTGLRAGELCWLRREDVELGRRRILIRAKDGWRPKHGRDRVVPLLDDTAVEILDRRLAAAGGPWVFSPPPSPRRKLKAEPTRLREKHLWEVLRAALTKLGISGTLHCTRHGFATYLANANVPMSRLKEFMGHQKIETTNAYYTFVSDAAESIPLAGMFAAPAGGGGKTSTDPAQTADRPKS